MSTFAGVNWAGNIAFEAREYRQPTSVDEVCSLVINAAHRGQPLRVVGTRHSFNEIANTRGVHVNLQRLPRVIHVAEDVVTVDGGATYAQVNTVLAQRNLALANLASLPHITVAGAVATTTHGSGFAQPCLADAVRAMTFVNAAGECVTVRRGEVGFEHYPVHLGVFGPVVSMELDVVPAFDIATTVYEGLDFGVTVANFEALVEGLYSFSIAPNWADGGTALLFAKRVRGQDVPTSMFGASAAQVARHPSAGADPVAVTEQLGVFGLSHERLTHFRSDFAPSVGDEVQSEYLIPRRFASQALSVLPQFARAFASLAHSMEIRGVAGDRLSASPFRAGDALAIHITWRRDVGAVKAFLPALEGALEPYEARPHWGKVFVTPPERIAELFPHLDGVAAAAKSHDPDGIFRNTWTEQYLPG